MSFISIGFSAIGKLISVVVLLVAFIAAMAGVVVMSLSGDEIKVPEITGKDFNETEKELASLGLRIRKRADRLSTEKINTILEQLPKAGETVKTGQWISVVVSKAGVEGEEAPRPLPNIEADDSEKIEQMISEKPRKPKANTNVNAKKKAETTRDIIPDETNSDSNSNDSTNSKGEESNKKETVPPVNPKGNKNTSTGPAMKPPSLPGRPGMADPRTRTQSKP